LRIATNFIENTRGWVNPQTLEWLLEGDPAIRWQTLHDLVGVDEQTIDQERQQVAEQGWGARLLALQEPSGMWGGGMYGPKWISTHYTMLTLRQIGLAPEHPQALKACQVMIDRGFFTDGGINFFSKAWKHSETCVTGMVLSILAWFHYADQRLDRIVEHLLGQQMPDGGWNCESYKGATHSSFHTTISVLEGLAEYCRLIRCYEEGIGERGKGSQEDIRTSQAKAHEFLLAHRLFRSHRTGEVFDARMLRFPFPPRYRYDVLRALDYFQGVGGMGSGDRGEGIGEEGGGAKVMMYRDERFQEAIELVRNKRKPDGRWAMAQGMTGRIFFELEKAGEPSRWNTLRALRVLKWWEGMR
jgi:hypothetical protein